MNTKYIIITAIACTVLAACTKDNPKQTLGDSYKPIVFESPIITPATKALVDFPKDVSFDVYAVAYNGDYDKLGWNGPGVQEFMKAETISYIADAAPKKGYESWGPATKKYWPKNPTKLAFSAYAPSKVSGASVDANGVVFKDYAIPTDVSKQVDLMYSERLVDQTENGAYNAVQELDGDDTQAIYGVQLKFSHALSSIRFRLSTWADYSAESIITLKALEFRNLESKGSFSQGLTPSENGVGEGKWTIPAPAVAGSPSFGSNFDTKVPENFVLGVAPRSDINRVFAIPQSINNDYNILHIEYSIKDIATDKTLNYSEDVKLCELTYRYDDNSDAGKKFEMGKQYTFNITIGQTVIYFAPIVNDWENVSAEYNSDWSQLTPMP